MARTTAWQRDTESAFDEHSSNQTTTESYIRELGGRESVLPDCVVNSHGPGVRAPQQDGERVQEAYGTMNCMDIRRRRVTSRDVAVQALAGMLAAGVVGYIVGAWPAAIVFGLIGAAVTSTSRLAHS